MTEQILWQEAAKLIEPELRSLINLAPSEVRNLTELALSAQEPAVWLAEELNRRGRHKKNLKEFYATQRKKDDAKKIRDVARWPTSHLMLKTQPWITESEGKMRFALIHCSDLLTVIEEGKAPVSFTAVEQIVETWSVD